MIKKGIQLSENVGERVLGREIGNRRFLVRNQFGLWNYIKRLVCMEYIKFE